MKKILFIIAVLLGATIFNTIIENIVFAQSLQPLSRMEEIDISNGGGSMRNGSTTMTDTNNGSDGTSAENPYCQNPEDCGITLTPAPTGISTSTSAKDLILGWVQFFLGFLFVISVVALVYAGVMYVISFGNDANAKKAQKIIMYTIMGIIIILLAYAIVNTVIRAGS